MLSDHYFFRSKSNNPHFMLLSKLTVNVDIYDNIPLGYMFHRPGPMFLVSLCLWLGRTGHILELPDFSLQSRYFFL